MADRARNALGLGKASSLNVLTPMTPVATWIVKSMLWFFDSCKSTQLTAKALAFLPFVHWVVVKRNQLPHLDPTQPRERLHYDYLFFLSTYTGPWGPYIDAFADVLADPLDAVWSWNVGYPGARPVSRLKAYITHNQIESDHHYSAYAGASVRDVRAALRVHRELQRFAEETRGLRPNQFAAAFNRMLIGIQNDLATTGTAKGVDHVSSEFFNRPAAERHECRAADQVGAVR
jgi:hypothetical protein